MPSMVVYWFSNWCRYVGLSNVGLYCIVLGGMVAIICISTYVMGNGFSLWLIMMVVVLWISWVAMWAQWIDVMTVLRSGRWFKPLHVHFDECARPIDPNIMSRYVGSCIGFLSNLYSEGVVCVVFE